MTSTLENHTWNKEIFDANFNAIFCNEEMHKILKENIGSFDLWFICMNYLLGRYESLRNQKNPAIFKPKGKIYYLNKLFLKIKPSIETWINPELKKNRCRDLDVLFISRDRFIEVNDGNATYKSDYLFHSVIQVIVKNYPSVKTALLCNTDAPQDMNIVGYNIFRFVRPFDFFKSLFYSLKKIIQWKVVQKMNPALGGNESGFDYPYLNVNSFFSFRILFNLFLIDYAYFNFLNTFNPKIIISNDDNMQLKPRSKNPDLKFVTLQSAIVSPINETYRRYFIREFGSDSVKSDYFICPGEYFKELKEYSNVAKEVVVMGQPRYDILARANEIYDKNKIISDLGLDPNKKIILWCTQTHGQSLDENVSSINAVYSTMASIKSDAQLLIKLHPDEDQNAPLYHENTLYQPKILKRDVDTCAILSICNLMITKNSTTAMEAVILNKPVIILNLSGDPDRVNYVHEGVALGVYDPANLPATVEKLLDDSSILHEKREDYIKKYLYKVDGKATERVVSLIKPLLEEYKC
jgi:CDP-glycerol glycerophosphotransferase (TagB/SpsB family)